MDIKPIGNRTFMGNVNRGSRTVYVRVLSLAIWIGGFLFLSKGAMEKYSMCGLMHLLATSHPPKNGHSVKARIGNRIGKTKTALWYIL